jgi:tetratricopeptide (TPR) repeat protein
MVVIRAAPPGETRREIARLVTQLDPTCEEAHRIVLEQLRRERGPGAAAAHYAGLERYFCDEFGVSPDSATRDQAFGLAEASTLMAEWTPASAPSPAPRRRPRLRIGEPAVDPADPRAATRAALVADDLAYLLAQSGEVDIVANNSGVVVDLALGGRLVVLERHARLYLWLTSPASPIRLWSERFDLAPTDDESAADACTARIATVVLQGVVRQLARLDAISSDSQLEAYRCFVEARELVDVTPNRERLRRALGLLEEAVAADPHNLIATIYLVRLLNTQLLETEAGADPAPGRRRALELATASYQLEPQSAAGNFVIGWCHLRQRHFDVARWHIEAALTLNPYHPERQTDAATAFMYLGDAERAMACVDQAMHLDPRHLDQRWADTLEIHLLRRDPQAALAAADRMRTLDIKRSAWLAVASAHAGEAERARHARDVAIAHGERLWVGREPFSPPALRRWLLDHLPFARPVDADYVRAGLDAAGWSD